MPFRTLLLTLLIAGCGSASDPSTGDPTFPADPLQTLTSDSGKLRVEVRTAPQPPTRGGQTVQLVVTDATTGAPQTGLALEVVPWMPAMGHGGSVVPSVSENPPGTYVLTNVELFMPGTWQLRTSISRDAALDHVVPSFQIP